MSHIHEHTHEHTHDGVTHSHAHTHEHSHEHGRSHEHSHDGAPLEPEKALALLTYMLDHNIHHCAELRDLCGSLSGEAAHLLLHAAESFDEANGYLAKVIEEMKK